MKSPLTIEELRKDLHLLEEAAEPNLPLGMEEYDPGYRISNALVELRESRMKLDRIQRSLFILDAIKVKLEKLHDEQGIIQDLERHRQIQRMWREVLKLFDDYMLIGILFPQEDK